MGSFVSELTVPGYPLSNLTEQLINSSKSGETNINMTQAVCELHDKEFLQLEISSLVKTETTKETRKTQNCKMFEKGTNLNEDGIGTTNIAKVAIPKIETNELSKEELLREISGVSEDEMNNDFQDKNRTERSLDFSEYNKELKAIDATRISNCLLNEVDTSLSKSTESEINSQSDKATEDLLKLLLRIRGTSSFDEERTKAVGACSAENTVVPDLSGKVIGAETMPEACKGMYIDLPPPVDARTESEASLSSLNLDEQIILEAPEEFRSSDKNDRLHYDCGGSPEVGACILSEDETGPLCHDRLVRDCNKASKAEGNMRPPARDTRETGRDKQANVEGINVIIMPKTAMDGINNHVAVDAPTNTMETIEDNRHASSTRPGGASGDNDQMTTVVSKQSTLDNEEALDSNTENDEIVGPTSRVLNYTAEEVTCEKMSSVKVTLANNNNSSNEIGSKLWDGVREGRAISSVNGFAVFGDAFVNDADDDDIDAGCAGASCVGDTQRGTSTASDPSIASDGARCAQAPRCSRIPTAWTSVAPVSSRNHSANSCKDPVTDSDATVTIASKCDTKSNCTVYTSELESDVNVEFNNLRKNVNSAKVVENSSSDPDLALLKWEFRNGRLVFDEKKDESDSRAAADEDRFPSVTLIEKYPSLVFRLSDENSDSCSVCSVDILCSRNINKKCVDSHSRIKYLESKLKEAAGISCDIRENGTNRAEFDESKYENVEERLLLKQCDIDKNQNIIYKTDSLDNQLTETAPIDKDEVDFGGSISGCEFDVQKLGSFKGFNSDDFYVVYDEYDELASSDDGSSSSSVVTKEAPITMGTDGDKVKQHNPDHENLKSLLKKPGRGRDGANKHRVVFNENKNEFFDADYIILIREECDYDDEDDDSVCTCNDHEMVRLTCCEPNCNCSMYETYSENTPPSPKFAPPFEFVDAVTLSPPEGYKDMELGEQQLLALQQMASRGQRAAVCKDCSQSHEDDGRDTRGENESDFESDQENGGNEETQKTDQSQQTTPTTPPADSDSPDGHYFNVETPNTNMNDEFERKRYLLQNTPTVSGGQSKISGILKGGRLWKQLCHDSDNKPTELQLNDSNSTSDDENNSNKRSVRFTEISETERDNCDGASDRPDGEDDPISQQNLENSPKLNNISVSPESTEMTLTFKLGNHFLVSNNSLKPNSAVRQLFPCSKPLTNADDPDHMHQYLVTAESLRAFEEAKRSKLPQIIQNDDTDESIKKAIERNTLRRSLIRYEPRSKRKEQKPDNSLVERIKQLTCDVDEGTQEIEMSQVRVSPPGEESSKTQEETSMNPKSNDKSFSPSSSSTASSNSSGSSTYKKITDLFSKKDKLPDIQMSVSADNTNKQTQASETGSIDGHDRLNHQQIAKVNSTNEARKQFLSSLAPLTACVGGFALADDHHYHLANNHPGTRSSVTSSVGTEYSLEDIDEGLRNGGDEDAEPKRVTPDVVAGTPSNESADELAMFVQQDASRIERIKKKYQTDNDEEDEHDDYGFNKRPSVRGIKPKFSTTTEILQQIQNHMQMSPAPVKVPNQMWPYYSETSLSNSEIKQVNINQSHPSDQYNHIPDDGKCRTFAQVYRPTSFGDNNIYQNCVNQQCTRDVLYRTNINHVHPVMRIGGGCSEVYQQPCNAKERGGRPESPPPLDMARTYHQTMVYIPYNHLENYQNHCLSPNTHYVTTTNNAKCYPRNYNQNQINARCSETYHKTVNYTLAGDRVQFQGTAFKQNVKPPLRVPFSSTVAHPTHSRSESPLPAQILTARSTQTPCTRMPSCTFYPTINAKFRPAVGPGNSVLYAESPYGSKINRQSFTIPASRYPAADNISFTDSDSQYSTQTPTLYRQYVETTFSAQPDNVLGSPTKQRFIERGVPEGAASVPSQDSLSSQSTMTSPTSPQQNVQTNTPKPLFYAMNV
ncbi:uncharacterized protein LOC108741127 [Agrilus planipennis]|uniref:Uncharacterized protein LOC108741127 n=1 Tax=Agrilus planipennis TaxID=224129 RepID=A0A1W4XFQ6_AGRPL|nr:uncharacterized protein LOC108741127 [Agrilus planipennis]